MTTINWERETGEKIEQFVAALILFRENRGNLITPSRGDRGVDVRVDQESGADIYQVKRYSRPLQSREKAEIQHSWNTFLTQTASALPMASWKLVLPLDPTNEALEWLDELTSGTAFPHEWIGRTQLDAWAAENPRLVDYYFGDGAERLFTLMQKALIGGRQPSTGAPSTDLLAAIQGQAVGPQTALDELDPLYRYPVEVRAGRIPEADQAFAQDFGAAQVTYEQISPDHFVSTTITPRTAAASQLQPITQQVVFSATRGSQDAEALEQFRLFGRPSQSIEAEVVKTAGPPGSPDPGRGVFTILSVAENAARLPLELCLLDEHGTCVDSLPADTIQVSAGLGTGGQWVSLTDPCDLITFEFMFGVPGHNRVLLLRTHPPHGQLPAAVARTLRFLSLFSDTRRLSCSPHTQ